MSGRDTSGKDTPQAKGKGDTTASEAVTTPPDTGTLGGLYALMDRYIDGDPQAFTKMHAILGPRLRGFLIRLVRDETAVDDLVQLTLLKAHLARGRFALQGGDPDGAVQGWYFAICRNVAMDHLRNRYRGKNRIANQPSDGSDPMVDLADTEPNVEELGQAAEREDAIIDRVRAAIDRLPAGQREVVVLHKLRGMSMAEIAERLAVREGAVRVRAHRAYKTLARMLSRGQIDVVAFTWLSSASVDASQPCAALAHAERERLAAQPQRTGQALLPGGSRRSGGSSRHA